MPNISFDIFFDQDFINITATRGKTAPKAKPEWKVRSAPKLPPKEIPTTNTGAVRPPGRPKINEGRGPIGKPTQAGVSSKSVEPNESVSQVGEKTKRKPPKLGPRKSAASAADVNGQS